MENSIFSKQETHSKRDWKKLNDRIKLAVEKLKEVRFEIGPFIDNEEFVVLELAYHVTGMYRLLEKFIKEEKQGNVFESNTDTKS